MSDPNATLELHARAVGALDDVWATIAFFEGVRATEPRQRLDVDEYGTPMTAPVPEGAALCSCGEVVPLVADFNECACGRVVSANHGERDPVDAAMRADTSRAARKRIRRHLDAIASHVEALVAEETKWTKPSGKRLAELRKLADGEVDQDTRDWSDWCRIHRRAGTNEPVTTQRPGDKLGLCWRCSQLYGSLLREKAIRGPEHATKTLERLVLDGNDTGSIRPEVITEAAGVTADVIDATSDEAPSTRKLPDTVRPKRGHHRIEDYGLQDNVEEAS